MMSTTKIIAGIPTQNLTLFHQTKFIVHDPAALIIEFIDDKEYRTLLVRSLEVDRAKKDAKVDAVIWPGKFEPKEGFDSDRELHTPQGLAEFLLQKKISHVTLDRNSPAVFWHCLERAGIKVECNPTEGFTQRRTKDEQEIEQLRNAQHTTEKVMQIACELIGNSIPSKDGSLQKNGLTITSEYVQHIIDIELLKSGYENPGSIVAGGPQGADCHELGSGPLYTSQPVIIDIFPKNKKTLYNGDCTRTVVNGEIPNQIKKMHSAILEAKENAIKTIAPKVSGNEVHEKTIETLKKYGFNYGMRPEDASPDWCGMVHGTGHGIGLEVHEPPSLGKGGGVLSVGDVITVEPGLYSQALGGIRIEDMVCVTDAGHENFNSLQESLDWKN